MKKSQKYYAESRQLKRFKILANIHRMRIIQLLLEVGKPMNVNTMLDRLEMSQSNLSNHLIKMRENNILRASQNGTSMFYSIKDPEIKKLVSLTK